MSTDIRTNGVHAVRCPGGYTRKAGTPEVEDGHRPIHVVLENQRFVSATPCSIRTEAAVEQHTESNTEELHVPQSRTSS